MSIGYPVKKLNLFSLVAALALFAMPWINIRCSLGVISQTGIQAITGGLTIEPAPTKMTEDQKEEPPQAAWLIALVFLAALTGAVIALVLTLFPSQLPPQTDTVFAAFALLLLIAQLLLGFPAINQFEGEVMQAMGLKSEEVEVRYTPWFFAELAMLAVPILLYGATALKRSREGV